MNKRGWGTSEQRHPCRYFPLNKFLFVGTLVNEEADDGFTWLWHCSED